MNEVSFTIFVLSMGLGALLSAQINAKYGFHVVCITVAAISLFAAIQMTCLLSSQ